ncbi:MAG: Glycerophosphodiester phosphodiesterase, cytoplasmic [Chloroflexi bacterium]|nr:Glycerophosphodiester phosphodiesterase, cytoplasmic [Chloroflexota bacterium]
MLEDLPKPAVIAHRGACAYAPENTLASFNLAIQQGADAIELDVTLSADDHLVVIHDKTVNRTTDGSGLVSKLPLQTLKELDAGSSYDIAFRGEQIPTLEEVFEAIGKKILINIELKGSLFMKGRLVSKVIECVKKHEMNSWVLFSSFNIFALKRMANLFPESPTGLLTYRRFAGICAHRWMNKALPYQSLHVSHRSVRKILVDRVHRQGQRVFVYTVNDPEDIQHLLELGVDGVFTDDPLQAREVIENHLE